MRWTQLALPSDDRSNLASLQPSYCGRGHQGPLHTFRGFAEIRQAFLVSIQETVRAVAAGPGVDA